jgi:YD repeat-containing protein
MRRAIPIVLGLLATSVAARADEDRHGVVARFVYHDDGRRTETIRTPENRTLESITRNPDGSLVTREKVQLNASGDPVQAMRYDAQNNLITKVVYLYDRLGRKTAERTYNRHNRAVRDVIYGYDENGKAKPPVARNYRDDTPRAPTAPMAPLITPQGKTPRPAPGAASPRR